jgi:hypothetical protein
LVAVFAVAVLNIGFDESVRVDERSGNVGEIEAALGKSCIAFCFIPFKFHRLIVVHWPTLNKLGTAWGAQPSSAG